MDSSDPTVGIDPMAVGPPRQVIILNKKVFLALPWYRDAHPLTAFCVAQLMDKRRVTAALNFGDAFVPHSRNSIADVFLSTDLEWMLTIDSDMVVPFGNARWFQAHCGYNCPEPFAGFNTIDRLLSHGKSLVGALYFGRHKHANAVYGEGAHTGESDYARKSAPVDLIKATKWVGTGCLMINRKVFEDIEKKFPRLGRGADGKGGNFFSSSEHNLADALDRTREFLSKGPMTGEKALKAFSLLESAAAEAKAQSYLGMGEDVQFCRRASQAGHQPFVDFGICAGHVGDCIYGPGNTFSKKI